MKNKLYKWRFVLVPVAIAACLSVISLLVMTLWNNLLPEILNTNTITFWQAMGIFILCKILFGFGRGHRMGPPWMRHKWSNMNSAEREKFRAEMRERMCGWKKERFNTPTESNDKPNI